MIAFSSMGRHQKRPLRPLARVGARLQHRLLAARVGARLLHRLLAALQGQANVAFAPMQFAGPPSGPPPAMSSDLIEAAEAAGLSCDEALPLKGINTMHCELRMLEALVQYLAILETVPLDAPPRR